MELSGLTEQQVKFAIENLDPHLERGAPRYDALFAELKRLYGYNQVFTSLGLSEFEQWTGYPIRGELAEPL